MRHAVKGLPISLPVAVLAAVSAPGGLAQDGHDLPGGFVYLDKAIPAIVVELKYTCDDNLVGQSIGGYRHDHAILSEPAAAALAAVPAALQPFVVVAGDGDSWEARAARPGRA